jgi:hypothetical protein
MAAHHIAGLYILLRTMCLHDEGQIAQRRSTPIVTELPGDDEVAVGDGGKCGPIW